jgi:hypothetical protein
MTPLDMGGLPPENVWILMAVKQQNDTGLISMHYGIHNYATMYRLSMWLILKNEKI